MKQNMNEYQTTIENLEKLRKYCALHMNEVDNFLNFGEGKYARIISGQSIELKDLITIASLYNLQAKDVLHFNLKMPAIKSLPDEVQSIKLARADIKPREQVKIHFKEHLILILSSYHKVGDIFSNNEIKKKLPDHLKDKAIEWNKTTLKEYVAEAFPNQKSNIKYTLIKEIPKIEITKALEKIGNKWLERESQGYGLINQTF